jgi:hypothetical protein
MIGAVGIAGALTATLHGFGVSGLAAMAAGGKLDPNVLRPRALRGRVLQIDPATGLTASAAAALRDRLPNIAGTRIGVVVASRVGNFQVVREFSNKVRRGHQSPVLFSASGYNVCAGLAAMAAAVNGPSLALAGGSAHFGDALAVAALGLRRGDADGYLVGAVSVHPRGHCGACAFVALTHEAQTSPYALAIGLDRADGSLLPDAPAPIASELPDVAAAYALVALVDSEQPTRDFSLPEAVIAKHFRLTRQQASS